MAVHALGTSRHGVCSAASGHPPRSTYPPFSRSTSSGRMPLPRNTLRASGLRFKRSSWGSCLVWSCPAASRSTSVCLGANARHGKAPARERWVVLPPTLPPNLNRRGCQYPPEGLAAAANGGCLCHPSGISSAASTSLVNSREPTGSGMIRTGSPWRTGSASISSTACPAAAHLDKASQCHARPIAWPAHDLSAGPQHQQARLILGALPATGGRLDGACTRWEVHMHAGIRLGGSLT